MWIFAHGHSSQNKCKSIYKIVWFRDLKEKTSENGPPEAYLWDDDVGQGLGALVDLHHVVQLEGAVVLHVVLDAVVDVRDLADVVTSVLHSEVLLQFRPTAQHQLQRLAVVQLDVWWRDDTETGSGKESIPSINWMRLMTVSMHRNQKRNRKQKKRPCYSNHAQHILEEQFT